MTGERQPPVDLMTSHVMSFACSGLAIVCKIRVRNGVGSGITTCSIVTGMGQG
jgi:hypothetical protein